MTPSIKRLLAVTAALIALWASALGADYWRTTHDFEKPVFAMCTVGADDGGSGTYKGIGYAVEIEGYFMPEDEFPGVTHAQFMIFGKQVKEVIRD